MSDDVVRALIVKIDKMALDLAIVVTKVTMSETYDTKQHDDIDKEIAELKTTVKTHGEILNQWLGSKMLILWLITTGIALYAAAKH